LVKSAQTLGKVIPWKVSKTSGTNHLAESDTIPLILGFEDVITEMFLVCDFREDVAYAMFQHDNMRR